MVFPCVEMKKLSRSDSGYRRVSCEKFTISWWNCLRWDMNKI